VLLIANLNESERNGTIHPAITKFPGDSDATAPGIVSSAIEDHFKD
jgi:hypothetical protein